ncbi:hypothetical protein HKX48_006092 [Thoreauomyces humboldtii]|nr:hypothetical protein HKX48_006092 [Thoreauomyces humboldtii]
MYTPTQSSPTPGATPPTLKSMKLNSAELATHNTLASRPMVAIRGKLYDLTDFVDRHPGGRDIMLLSAGRDVTQVYETYHDMARTENVLRKYLVGDLTDSALPTFPAPSAFQTTLRSRVSDHFRKSGKDQKFHPLHLVHYAFVGATIAASYAAQLWVPTSCFTIVHDASHASFSHKPWVWTVFGAWHDFMNGASHVAWFYQHVLGHHPYTNLPDADPDVGTSHKHFRRIRPHQKWYSFYLSQHIYAPLMYGLYGLKSRWDDVSNIYITRSRGAIKINPLQPHQHAIFWVGKLFFFAHRLILPCFFIPVGRAVALFLLADVATSMTLALVFQANHVVEHVSWPAADKTTNKVDTDWMQMQIETAQDYAHDSVGWTKFTGGLNYQVVHHAFPNVCQWWYMELGPVVRDTCKEFGVVYVVKATFWEAIKDHIDLLWTLGREEVGKDDHIGFVTGGALAPGLEKEE